jgi:hypothetical protein
LELIKFPWGKRGLKEIFQRIKKSPLTPFEQEGNNKDFRILAGFTNEGPASPSKTP